MESFEESMVFPIIGGFRTVRHLDEGSGSTVWVVEDDSTKEEFALKILPRGATDEAAAAESPALRHEFLVDGLGLVSTSLGPGILMEYCPAGSAAQVVAVRGPLGVGEVITVMAPIAAALAFLHERGLMHGDLSPRNILFTAEGKPKLCDFGTHRIVGQSPTEFGTQGFCAPETASEGAAGTIEPARDIYALAACTWYLLTGRPPNATASRVPLGSMVPEVNDEFAKLLEQSLAQDPAIRPSAEQFGQRIFVAGEPLPVELTDAVEHDALKHMLTTRQTPKSGGPRRRGAPSAADKQLLKERKVQIKAQQKPVPRKLRAAFAGNGTAESTSQRSSAAECWASGHRIHRLKRGNRRILVALGSGALLVAVSAGGAVWINGNAASTTARETQALVDAAAVAPVTSEPRGDPALGQTDRELVLVAADLSARRDSGLMNGKMAALSEVHAPGSPSLGVDEKVMAAMKKMGFRLEGLETRLINVQVLPGDVQGRATLQADSQQAGYHYLDATGAVVVSAGKTESQRIRMVLKLTDGSWRLWEVSAVE